MGGRALRLDHAPAGARGLPLNPQTGHYCLNSLAETESALYLRAWMTKPKRPAPPPAASPAPETLSPLASALDAQYRAIFAAALDAMLVVDGAGEIVIANEEAERMFGHSLSELVGEKIEVLLPERYREAHPGQRERYFSRPVPRPMGLGLELKGLHASGEEFPLEISLSPVELGEELVVLATIRDLSERDDLRRKLAERERASLQASKLEAIGQLAGGIAHDFNNMLAVIIGFTERASDLLAREPLDRALAQDSLAHVLKAAERSADLCRRILSFSRQQPLRPEVLDLKALVAETQPMLSRVLGEPIELHYVLTQRAFALVDPAQLEQAVLNLALNARDAMPQGGRLLIELRTLDLDEQGADAHQLEPGSYAVIGVSDTGSGMDAETRERAFEPFFTTKSSARGTGLGLSMVHGLVKQSGGHIYVYSEPGLGTTFKLYFPRQPDPEGEEPILAPLPRQRRDNRETLLVVEDELLVNDMLTSTLEAAGFRVLSADSGERALELARATNEAIDLVVTDMIMPGMNGRDLARELRRERPELGVLFISGYTDNVLFMQGELRRGVNFLEKPMSSSALVAQIQAMLERQEPAER